MQEKERFKLEKTENVHLASSSQGNKRKERGIADTGTSHPKVHQK